MNITLNVRICTSFVIDYDFMFKTANKPISKTKKSLIKIETIPEKIKLISIIEIQIENIKN